MRTGRRCEKKLQFVFYLEVKIVSWIFYTLFEIIICAELFAGIALQIPSVDNSMT